MSENPNPAPPAENPTPPPSVETVRSAPRVTKLEKENASLQDQLSQERTLRQELEGKMSSLRLVPPRDPARHKSLLEELDEFIWGPKAQPQTTTPNE